MAYSMPAKHDGRVYQVQIPEFHVPKCEACGELIFGDDADNQITEALRAMLRLLTPQQIRAGRKVLRLSQERLAECLGVAAETISRWETGGLIQSRAMDNFLRVFFGFPEVRTALCGAEQDPELGTKVATEPEGGRLPAGKNEKPVFRLVSAAEYTHQGFHLFLKAS
jgi:putative zinc finger/helix-turn-helix YgiT family protein